MQDLLPRRSLLVHGNLYNNRRLTGYQLSQAEEWSVTHHMVNTLAYMLVVYSQIFLCDQPLLSNNISCVT
jgi:hypothetical protein